MIDAERGLVLGLRGDGNLFACFFSGCILLAAGLVLGLSLIQWSLLAISMTVVLVAGILHQALRALLQSLGEVSHQAGKMASGAVLVAFCGLIITAGLILLSRLWELLSS